MKLLMLDMNNLLNIHYHVHKKTDPTPVSFLRGEFNKTEQKKADVVSHTFHSVLETMYWTFKEHSPDKIICCFDRPSWRIDYTKSSKCVSGRLYKGRRNEGKTTEELDLYAHFKEHMGAFEGFLRANTTLTVLSQDKLEADDLMAGVCQHYPGDTIVIISSDKDMMQLVTSANVKLINPLTKEERTLEEWDYNVDLWLFEKCVRGDMKPTGDNIQSAFPGVYKKRIVQAFNDPFHMSNFLAEKIQTPAKEFLVGDVIKENMLLICLKDQPDWVRVIISETITEAMEKQGGFNIVEFMRFCNTYRLNNILKYQTQYSGMFQLM